MAINHLLKQVITYMMHVCSSWGLHGSWLNYWDAHPNGNPIGGTIGNDATCFPIRQGYQFII